MPWLSIAGGVFLTWVVLVFLFTPGINYHLSLRTSVHESDFLYTLQSTCQAALHHGNAVTVFTNGVSFYPAMLECDRPGATRSINMECYIFQPGKIADQFIAALSAKAQARVNGHHRRGRHRKSQPVGTPGAATAKGGLPDRVVPAAAMVFARAIEQPHSPRTAGRRRQSRVCRRRGDRRLVGVSDAQAHALAQALARHDGAHRGAGGRCPAGGGGRELAGMLWRDPHGSRILSQPRRPKEIPRRSSSRARRRIAPPRRA